MRFVRAPIGREQRERRGELPGEVMHPHVCPVDAELLGGYREFDALLQGVCGRAVRPTPAQPGSGRRREIRCASP